MLRVLRLADPSPHQPRRAAACACAATRRRRRAARRGSRRAASRSVPWASSCGRARRYHSTSFWVMVVSITGTMLVSSSGRCTPSAALIPSSAASTGAASSGRRARPPGGKRRVERAQVHEHDGVLLLHALDVLGARRGALLERAPEPLVLALVVRVQAERGRRQLVRHGLRVAEVAGRRRARTSAGPSPKLRRNIRWISIMPLASQVFGGGAGAIAPGRKRGRGHGGLLRRWIDLDGAFDANDSDRDRQWPRVKPGPRTNLGICIRAVRGIRSCPSAAPGSCRAGCAASTGRPADASTPPARGTCTTAHTPGSVARPIRVCSGTRSRRRWWRWAGIARRSAAWARCSWRAWSRT